MGERRDEGERNIFLSEATDEAETLERVPLPIVAHPLRIVPVLNVEIRTRAVIIEVAVILGGEGEEERRRRRSKKLLIIRVRARSVACIGGRKVGGGRSGRRGRERR